MAVEVATDDRPSCPQCKAVFRGAFQRCPRDGAELTFGQPDPLIGSVLAERYVIESLLGEGGIGRVYQARHVRMSRRYAIKVPFGELAYDPKVRSRFHNEAEAASRLQHPNVIGVVDVGEGSEGLLYLAMDLAEGDNLADVLHRNGPLSRERVLRITRQIAEGLAHAHERGLIHRDLKPENVILETGDQERARIVDFGIAIMADEGTAGRLTTEGIVLGTPHYMAPEQACGQEIDHRTDLFALGLMIYEMLAGVLPFEGSPIDVARKNLSGTPPRIADRVPGLEVDRLLEALAFWLMEKKPDDRPQRADDVVEMLWAIENDPDAAMVKLHLGDVADVDEMQLAPVVSGLLAPRRASTVPGVAAKPTPVPRASSQGGAIPGPSGRAATAPPRAPSAGLSHEFFQDSDTEHVPLETERFEPRRRGFWVILAIVLLAALALVLVLTRDRSEAKQAAAAPAPDAAVPVVVTTPDAAVLAPVDAAVEIVVVVPDAGTVKPPKGNGKRKIGKPDVKPGKPDAGVAKVDPPVPDEPPSEKSLTSLYNQVGQQLNKLLGEKGSDAAAAFKKRYLGIPYLEAIRKPALRVDAMAKLRALARDIGKAL